MSLQYTPYALLSLASAAALAVLAAFAWRRRRNAPAAGAFAALMLAGSWWKFAYALELASAGSGAKLLWAKAEYLGVVFVPLAWLALALAYAGVGGGRARRRVLVVLAVVPLATLALVWTNGAQGDPHGLVWASAAIDRSGPFAALEVEGGPWYGVHVAYSYALVLAGTVALAAGVARSSRPYRPQGLALLAGALVSWGANASYLTGAGPVPNLNPSVLAFPLTGALFALGLFRFGLLDLSPVARDAAFGASPDGLIVADPRGRVADLNPAAERILGGPARSLLGESVSRLIPARLPPLDAAHPAGGVAHQEVSLGDRREGVPRRYELAQAPLEDPGGRRVGRLLSLRDVTERRRAEEALRESEARFRGLVRNSSDLITLVDADGAIAWESPSKERILGYGPEELAGRHVLDHVHPDDLGMVSAEFADVLAHPGYVSEGPVGFRYRHKDGSWRHLESLANNLLDDPAVGGVVINSRDVTERVRAERALRGSEEGHRRRARELGLLHRARTALVQELDPQAVCRAAVEAVAETYGYALVSAYLLEGGPEEGELVLRHQVGYKTVIERIPVTEGVMGRAVREGRSALLEDAAADPDFLGAMEGIASEACVVLFNGDEAVGVLNVESTGGARLSGEDLRLLEAVGEHAGMALGRARLHARTREAEERYRTLVDNMPAVAYVEDLGGRRPVYVSPRVRDLVGHPPERFTNEPGFWWGLVHPDDRERMLSENARSDETEGPFGAEYRLIAKDGRVVWVRDEAFLVRDGGAGGGYWQGVMLDITERKEAEEALKESAERYRALVQNASDVITLLDPDGRVRYMSPAVGRVTGYRPEELAGGNVFLHIHPGDRERVMGAFAEGVADPASRPTAEYRFRHKDGSWRRLESIAASLLDAPAVGAVVVNTRDVTERREAEEALRESEERYRTVLEQVEDGYFEVDLAGNLTFFNDSVARMLGYPREELMGMNNRGFMDRESAERVYRHFNRVYRTGEPSKGFDWELTKKDGAKLSVETSVSLMRDPEGEPVGFRGVIRDVTDRKEAEEALRESEERFRALVQNASDMISILGPDGRIRYVSPAVEWVLGYRPEERVGADAFGAETHPEDLERTREAFARGLGRPGGVSPTFEFRVRHKDGSWRHLEAVATNRLGHPAVGGIVVNARDVTERKAYEERLERQAFHDALTGLPNRRLFQDRLGHALARAQRGGGKVAVLFADLDNFKYVNDSLGHGTGDELLAAAARRLEGCVRPGDTVARLGGDEFAVLLEGVEDAGEAARVAGRAVEALGEPFDLGEAGREVFSGTSVGVALGEAGLDRPEDLLRKADLALYEAKAGGKAGYALFDPEAERRSVRRLELENGLRRALERDEIVVRYQPLVSLRSGWVVGFEALARWEHPELGLLSPDEFVPLAEETGLIVPIGERVLREACRQAKGWQERHPSGQPPSIGVNLSARQLSHPDLVGVVEAVLRETGLDTGRLTLEVTEGVLVERAERHAGAVRRLKALGVRFAIDDFGTGYSSLSYLRRLPAGIVKLDGSFVEGIGEGAGEGAGGDEVLLEGVVGIAHGLGLEVCAEGVETAGQAARLRELGCDLAQGYLFSGPLTAEAASELVRAAAEGGANGEDHPR